MVAMGKNKTRHRLRQGEQNLPLCVNKLKSSYNKAPHMEIT